MRESAILKYILILMDRRHEIIQRHFDHFGPVTEAEKAELEWIRIRMGLVDQIQRGSR